MVLVMVPAGPPADRLDAARLRRRAAAVLRRAAVRAVPAGAARHLRGVLPALRRSPAWSPTATGTAPGWPGCVPGPIARPPAAGARCAALLWRPWLLAGGRLLGAGARHQVGGGLPAGGLRRCWCGCGAPGARRSFGVRWRGAALRGRRRRPGVRAPRAGRARRLRRHLDRLAAARRRLRDSTSPTRSTPTTTGQGLADLQPSTTRTGFGEVVQSLRSLWHYHHDVYVFHTHFLNDAHAHLPVQAAGLAAAQPPGRASQADLGIKPGTAGLRRPGRAAPACARCCCSAPRRCGGAASLALLYAVVVWVGARDWRFGLAVVGVARRPGCRGCTYDDRPIFSYYAIVTLPFIVLAITLCLGTLIGASRAPTAAAHGRGGRRRRVRRAGAA